MQINDKIGRTLDRHAQEDRPEVQAIFDELHKEPRLRPLLERSHERLEKRRTRRFFLMSSMVAVIGIGSLGARLAPAGSEAAAAGMTPTVITAQMISDDLDLNIAVPDRASLILQQVDLAADSELMVVCAMTYVEVLLMHHRGTDAEVVLPGVSNWMMGLLQRSQINDNIANAGIELSEWVFPAATMAGDREVFCEILERRR